MLVWPALDGMAPVLRLLQRLATDGKQISMLVHECWSIRDAHRSWTAEKVRMWTMDHDVEDQAIDVEYL